MCMKHTFILGNIEGFPSLLLLSPEGNNMQYEPCPQFSAWKLSRIYIHFKKEAFFEVNSIEERTFWNTWESCKILALLSFEMGCGSCNKRDFCCFSSHTSAGNFKIPKLADLAPICWTLCQHANQLEKLWLSSHTHRAIKQLWRRPNFLVENATSN